MNNSHETFIAHFRIEDQIEQSVREHLVNTAEYASLFASDIGMPHSGKILGLLHDLGKWTDLFNRYIRSGTGLISKESSEYLNPSQWKGQIDHATAGAQYLYQHSSLNNTIAKEVLGLCIKSHHGGLRDCLAPDGINLLEEKLIQKDEKTRLQEALKRIDSDILISINQLCTNELNKEWEIMIGLMRNSQQAEIMTAQMLEDQIKKMDLKEAICKRMDFILGLLTRHLFSCLIDADRIDTSDFDNPRLKDFRQIGKTVDWEPLICKLEAHILQFVPKNKVDEIRAQISKKCFKAAIQPQNIFDLTVPTGGGKTLASLRFALHHARHNHLKRIIIVVPYTTIIDQNAQTVRDILERDAPLGSIVLEHHSNLTPEEENEQTKCLSENWDAPIIYTTMVQLMETFFAGGTRSVRRMHRLAKAVVIFDEIQNLDVKCVKMFNLSMNYLHEFCHSSVVLCTATQPLLSAIEPKPMALQIKPEQRIISDPDALHKDLIRTEIIDKTKVGGYSQEEVAQLIGDIFASGKSVLVIVNTKKAAKELLESCRQISQNLFHLSTSMCPEHRRHVLQHLISDLQGVREKTNPPVICISTQLIEAGVDVDFDAVIRYMAGLDSIVQAAGRCNRNGLMPERGQVYIVNPNYEDLSMLKDIQKARTEGERVLYEFKKNPAQYSYDLQSPMALAQYYTYYFYQRKGEMEYNVTIDAINSTRTLVNLLSSNSLAVNAAKQKDQTSKIPFLKQSFQTAGKKFKAIDAYTQGIIVPYKEGRSVIAGLCNPTPQTIYELIKKAQRYSVNVFAHQFQKYMDGKIIFETHAGSGIFYLANEYYDDELGMINDPKIKEVLLY